MAGVEKVENIGRYFPPHVPALAASAARHEPIVRQRAGIVIICEGKVALIRREHVDGKAYYLVPGGGVEVGEALEQAAVCEPPVSATLVGSWRKELGHAGRNRATTRVIFHGGTIRKRVAENRGSSG